MADFGKGGGEWNANAAVGDDITITWQVFDENGDPMVWTGYAASAPVGGGQWTVDISVTGQLAVTLTDSQTSAFGVGSLEQYLRFVKAGVTSTWMAGVLKLRPPTEPLRQSPQPRTIQIVNTDGGTIRLQGCVVAVSAGGGGAPSGPAGGVLSGTYPNPGFAQDMATQTELNAVAAGIGLGGPPSGPAGGVLSGTYPNPGFASDMATQAELDAAVAAKANLSHTHAAADIASGVIAPARLGTGTPGPTTTLYGDGAWRASSGGGTGPLSTCKQTSPLTSTSTALANLAGQAFSLLAGHRYLFHFMGKFQSAATTTGAKLGFSAPAVTSFVGRVEVDQGTGGTAHLFTNSSIVPTDVIGSLAVDVANTDVAWSFSGVIQPSADGTLQLRGASEVSASQVIFQNTGAGYLIDCDYVANPPLFASFTPFTSTMTGTASTPASGTIWETFELGTDGDPMSLGKLTADSITKPGADSLFFSSLFSLNDGISCHVLGHDLETLNYVRPLHTTHYLKYYHLAKAAPSESVWLVYVMKADQTTVAYRFGVDTSNRFIVQDGISGSIDTTNFSCVAGKLYKLDNTAVGTAGGTSKVAVFDETNINGTAEAGAADVITITPTSPTGFTNTKVGINVALTGGGSTIPANLTDEGFNGTNGVQITNLNTTADSHSGGGSCTFLTTSPAEGASKCRVHGTTSDINVYLNPSHTVHKISFYLDFTTEPTGVLGTAYFGGVKTGDNTAVALQVGIDTSKRLTVRNAANGTGANALTISSPFVSGQRYRVEISATALGACIADVWNGATLNSTSPGARWATATMASPLTASNLGREQTGLIADVTTAPDFSIDRWKSNDTLMPSPIGTGTGSDFECFIEEFRVSSTSMPPNLNVQLNGGNQFSSILVPSNGMIWGAAMPTLDTQGTDSLGITQWVGAACDGTVRNYPDAVHLYVSLGWRGPTAQQTAWLNPAGKKRAIGVFNWQWLQGGNTPLSVANGSADADAAALGAAIGAYPNKIFLNMEHEYDKVSNRGSTGWTDANYAAAWRRLYGIIKPLAPNAIFIWIITGSAGNAGNLSGQWWDTMYPGDAYVDWIGFDPYFQKPDTKLDLAGLLNNNVGNTANGYQGVYWWATTYHPGKPIAVTEWGTWFETPFGTTNAPAPGLTDADAASRINSFVSQAPDFPDLKMMLHFNSHKENDNCIQRPAPNARTLTKAAMVAVGQNPYFNVWLGIDP